MGLPLVPGAHPMVPHDQDDDLSRRVSVLPAAEFRRRVDLAIGFVREQRCALAVHAGMTLEDAPGPIPSLELEAAEQAYREIAESLPLLRRPLTPEERKRLIQPTKAEQLALAEVMQEAAAMDPEDFRAAVEEHGLDVTQEQLAEIQDGMKKMEMLGELQREVEILLEELSLHRDRLAEEAQAIARNLIAQGGPPN